MLLRRGEGPSFPGKTLPSVCSSRLEPITAMSSRSCLVLVRRGWWPACLAESWGLFPALPQGLLLWASVALASVSPSCCRGSGREVLCLSFLLPMYLSAALPLVCFSLRRRGVCPVLQVRSFPWHPGKSFWVLFPLLSTQLEQVWVQQGPNPCAGRCCHLPLDAGRMLGPHRDKAFCCD